MEIISELFKQSNPLAWAIGAVSLIVLGLLANKIIPQFQAKQAFIIVTLVIFLIPIMLLMNRLFPESNKPPEAKKLTLILHEPGNPNIRPLHKGGRVELRDTKGHRIEWKIDEKSAVAFDSLPDWVFDDKIGVTVAVFPSVVDRMYSSENALRFFQPNKEYDVELIKTELPVVQQPEVKSTTSQPKRKSTKPVKTKLDLVFVSKTANFKKPFQFGKDNTMMELEEDLLDEFKNIIGAKYGDLISLTVNGKLIAPNSKSLSLVTYGLKDNDEVGIFKSAHMMKTFPKATFYFINRKFTKPIVYIDNNKIEDVKNDPITSKVTVVGSIFNPNDSCSIRIMDGLIRYNFKLLIKDKKEITVDMTNYKGIDFSKFKSSIFKVSAKSTLLKRVDR